MNRKLAIFVVVLLLGGAAAVAIIKSRGGDEGSGTGAVAGGPAAGAVPSPEGGSEGGLVPSGSKSGERKSRDGKDGELAEKYGGARTSLSRHVSGNVVSLLEDAIAVGEMMSEGFGGGGNMVGGVLRGTGIELTDEQREKAATIISDFRKRELDKSRKAVSALKNDPTSLMELFLAGDARERGEMSEEEYALIQRAAGENLMGVINPLDRNNFRGGSAWQDETFQSEFAAILDQEQAEKWDASVAEREAEQEEAAAERVAEGGAEGDQTNISTLPTMELETLDEAIGSAKQMASGFKQVMEGMGNLRDLQPQIEGQPEGGAE